MLNGERGLSGGNMQKKIGTRNLSVRQTSGVPRAKLSDTREHSGRNHYSL